VTLCALACCSPARSEGILLPYAHKLFINPSFAGFNKNSTLWTGMQFEEISGTVLNYSHLLSYDFYSEKLNGGVAICYIQELFGRTNLNNTGAGFIYSRKVLNRTQGQLTASANIYYLIGTKQWFVHITDGLLKTPENLANPPGKKFHRHNTIVPGTSLLWSSDFIQAGITAIFAVRRNTLLYDSTTELLPPGLIFYLSKINTGIKNGLISRPFEANPEVTVLFAENTFLTRAGIRVDYHDHNCSVFTQNDFKRHVYGISGILGWNLNNIRFSFSLGCSYSTQIKRVLLQGEAGIGLFIKGDDYNENKPWTRPKN